MIKRLFIISAMIAVGVFAFVGCGNGGNKYNAAVTAKRYEEVVDLLNGEFLQDNQTYGASYTVFEDDKYISEYCLDENCPEERTFIIDNVQEFEDIFIVTPQEYGVDLESRMLIIYSCTAFNVRQVSIKSVSYGSGNLKIKLQTKKPTQAVGDTCQPYQRYMFITMDKLEITTLTVEYD